MTELPEFTYEQIVEGKRPPVLSGPYIPAYLVRMETERYRAALERIAWHELTWKEARDVAREVLAKPPGNL
jgi:hypothetical protein